MRGWWSLVLGLAACGGVKPPVYVPSPCDSCKGPHPAVTAPASTGEPTVAQRWEAIPEEPWFLEQPIDRVSYRKLFFGTGGYPEETAVSLLGAKTFQLPLQLTAETPALVLALAPTLPAAADRVVEPLLAALKQPYAAYQASLDPAALESPIEAWALVIDVRDAAVRGLPARLTALVEAELLATLEPRAVALYEGKTGLVFNELMAGIQGPVDFAWPYVETALARAARATAAAIAKRHVAAYPELVTPLVEREKRRLLSATKPIKRPP